ncbi:aldose 1-epimerase [Streptomyces brevispora]|uniref:Aldose 1-epimerase n=1 Tax=Streptomyces brevispora TaxID=887462 RepID=A0A561TU38_9ACTN|nr:aldose 1-epimerase family protein [Streptomyces brevispora]TWF90594.1 aldose 1-epimerase [Streptomyces brevispora]
MAAPSGNQYEIRHGEQLAVIAEVGAGLQSYLVGERRILDGYGPEERCTGARGHSMIPWPNRIRGGKYTWAGKEFQLDLSEPEKLGAIHGLTRWAPWRYLEGSAHSAAFGYVLHACPGRDWVLDCRLQYTLGADGLTVCTTVTNRSGTACPYATGAHPYLSVSTPRIDTAACRVPGAVYLPVGGAGIPTGRRLVDGTPYDLREPQSLGDRHIDVAYTQLRRDVDGRARVRPVHGEGPAVTLWVGDAYPYVEIFTGDTLPEADRRRTGLGVEPMTCAPDAFNSREGLITLEPGRTHQARWGIDPECEEGMT